MVSKTLEVGMVGYYQQRITASTGKNAAAFYPYSRVAAVGPAVTFDIPSWKLSVMLQDNIEFYAVDRAQGNTVEMSLVKAF
jgi:hypothetical protein